MQQQADRFAAVIAAEGVKTMVGARVEVARCVETLQVAAQSADVLTGQMLPMQASERGVGRMGWYTLEPLGVIGAISSFNDPLNLVAHKIAPALLAGAAIVVNRPTRRRSRHWPWRRSCSRLVFRPAGYR